MRAVLQRVLNAKVVVQGETIGEIDKGIMVLVGFKNTDDKKALQYILDKIIHLRIFEDENEKMNLSLMDIKGELLIVPNFTLYGDCRKGRRPSYSSAASIDEANGLYNQFIEMSNQTEIKIQTGEFQADMKVSLTNDGPITLMIDSEREF